MAAVQQKILGVEIAAKAIKIVLGGGNNTVSKSLAIPLPEGAVRQGRPDVPELIMEKMEEAKKAFGSSVKRCAICIGGPDVVTRQMMLPVMNDHQNILMNVVSEISAYLPVNAQSFQIDYRVQGIMDGAEENKLMKVLVAAAPKDTINAHMKCLSKTGWKVAYVDIAENAQGKLVNAMLSAGGASPDAYAVIDLGYSGSLISVFDQGQLFFSRRLGVGIQRFTEAAAEGEDMDLLTAEKQLYNYDCFASNAPQGIRQRVEAQADYIANEAKRIFNYFSSRNNQAEIGRVFVCGGGAAIPGMLDYLQESFRISVAPIAASLIKPSNSNGSDAVDFTNALGATYREVETIDIAK